MHVGHPCGVACSPPCYPSQPACPSPAKPGVLVQLAAADLLSRAPQAGVQSEISCVLSNLMWCLRSLLAVQVPVPTGPHGLDVDGLQKLLEQPGAPR